MHPVHLMAFLRAMGSSPRQVMFVGGFICVGFSLASRPKSFKALCFALSAYTLCKGLLYPRFRPIMRVSVLCMARPTGAPCLWQSLFNRARSSAVEHLTFNQRVDGSKPSGLTIEAEWHPAGCGEPRFRSTSESHHKAQHRQGGVARHRAVWAANPFPTLLVFRSVMSTPMECG